LVLSITLSLSIAKELRRCYRSKEPNRELAERDARQKLRAIEAQAQNNEISSIQEILNDFLNGWQDRDKLKLDNPNNYYLCLFFLYFYMKQPSLKN